MEHSINLNEEKTAKLTLYKEKDKLRIDVMDFRSDTPLQFSIYLDYDEANKLEHVIYDIKREIKDEAENKE